MNLNDFESILDKAYENALMEIDNTNAISAELSKAWNRGARAMLNESLLLFILNERSVGNEN